MSSIGSRIAQLRKQRGISKSKLAQAVGVSHQAVCQWEQDKSSPVNGNLTKLADILDCSTRYLLTGDKSKFDDFEMILLNALAQAGIKFPKDHKPPDHFRRQYRAGQITRRECLRLIREEFVKLRLANEWLPATVPLVAAVNLVSSFAS